MFVSQVKQEYIKLICVRGHGREQNKSPRRRCTDPYKQTPAEMTVCLLKLEEDAEEWGNWRGQRKGKGEREREREEKNLKHRQK